jgi:hypothetical protein
VNYLFVTEVDVLFNDALEVAAIGCGVVYDNVECGNELICVVALEFTSVSH